MTVSLLENAGASRGVDEAAAQLGRHRQLRDRQLRDQPMTTAEIAAAPPPAGVPHDDFIGRANLSPLARCAETAEQIACLWPNRVAAAGLTILCASRQAGATAVALDIASRVSTGMPFPDEAFGHARRPAGQVLFVADGPTCKRLAARLTAVGAVLDRCAALPLLQASDHTLELAPVEAVLARLPGGCRLLVFDALRVGLWRDGELDDESSQLFESLERLAERFGVAVLAVVRLPGIGNPSRRALGALASCVAADCALVVARDDTVPEHRSLCALRCVGEVEALVFRFRRGRAGMAPAIDWRREAGEGDECAGLAPGGLAAERRSAAEWLIEELRDGARAVHELKAAAMREGYSWNTIRRAKRRLGVESTNAADGRTRRVIWTLRRETWSGTMPGEPRADGSQELRGMIVQQVDPHGWKAALLAEIRPLDQYPPLEGGQGGQKPNVSAPKDIE